WKDATVTNSTLTFPAGQGGVTLSGSAFVMENTPIRNGGLVVNGAVNGGGRVTCAGGALRGSGTVNGAGRVLAAARNASGSSIGTLTINGALSLAGTTLMEISKSGATLSSDLITGVSTLTYGGTLTVSASGDALASGDTFQLFSALSYSGAFASLTLPTLAAGLVWDTSRLNVDGSIRVVGQQLPGSMALWLRADA